MFTFELLHSNTQFNHLWFVLSRIWKEREGWMSLLGLLPHNLVPDKAAEEGWMDGCPSCPPIVFSVEIFLGQLVLTQLCFFLTFLMGCKNNNLSAKCSIFRPFMPFVTCRASLNILAGLSLVPWLSFSWVWNRSLLNIEQIIKFYPLMKHKNQQKKVQW